VNWLDVRDFVHQVKGVKTLDGGHPVYRNAKVSIVRFSPADVYPTSKYVLVSKISTIFGVYRAYKRIGIDIFNLLHTVVIDGRAISPPVVEHDGQVPVIVDGIHRFWVAKAMRKEIRAVFIKGADPDFPVIGLPVAWKDVKVRRTLPKNPRDRRNLRPGIEDTSDGLRKYFRDLSFLGGDGRRPSGKQKN